MIEVRNLKKCFEGAPALEQVNLTVEPGLSLIHIWIIFTLI